MDIKATTSNNTVYADKGNIAYWHGNFVPIRDPKLNWSKVVDGTTTTQWKGLHEVSEIVHSYNPENGWLQNCNSTPLLLQEQTVKTRKLPTLHGT
jgi:acyl-homoserine lactone acylase PvdQ